MVNCWKTWKQRIVALSSCEAEYITMAPAVLEGLFLQEVFTDLQCNDVNAAITLYVDNQGTIELSKNSTCKQRQNIMTQNIILFQSYWKLYTLPHTCVNKYEQRWCFYQTCISTETFKAALSNFVEGGQNIWMWTLCALSFEMCLLNVEICLRF